MLGWFKKRKSDVELVAAVSRAAAEGAERARAVRALATIDTFLDPSFDDRKFCTRAVVAVVGKLAESSKSGPIWLDDDHRFTAGVFAFTLSNALTYRLGAPFELVASGSAFILTALSEDAEADSRDVDDIADAYNVFTKEGDVINAIGQTFVRWLVTPSPENYVSLAELYAYMKEHVALKN